jgi:predicted transcriptional regulator
MVKGYFGGSFQSLVSFFAAKNKMDVQDIDQLVKQLQELKKQKR